MAEQTSWLLKLDREYNGLLKFLMSHDFYNDYEIDRPSIKGLSQDTGIEYNKLRKYIRQIYEDMVWGVEDVVNDAFSFDGMKFVFLVYGNRNNSACFEADSIPVVPRAGKEMEIPFFKAWLVTERFYVESVQHQFYQRNQEILITLRQGSYNLYWHYRKHKAEEEGELHFRDFRDLDDWELKRKLGVGGY